MNRALVAFALVLASCGGAAAPTPTPGPPLGEAARKEAVIAAVGRPAYCDPDLYPLARTDEAELAQQRIGEIRADAATYGAIVARVGSDVLTVYREWKALRAIQLGAGGEFTLRVQSGSTYAQVEGTVDPSGRVTVARRSPSTAPNCPICLAEGTRISTPLGEIAIELLRPGDPIWTAAAGGARVASVVLAVGSMDAAPAHEMALLVLSDGRAVRASPGHPTADGRRAGDLRAGDAIDGATIVRASRVRYTGTRTYDVLPRGGSGAYWADGVPLGSTLR